MNNFILLLVLNVASVLLMILANALYKKDSTFKISAIAVSASLIAAIVTGLTVTFAPVLANTVNETIAFVVAILAAIVAAFVSASIYSDHSDALMGVKGYKIFSAIYYILVVTNFILLLI